MNSKKFEFRIIAGSLKGRKIYAPDLGVTRPPLSRLRKSIFDFLAPYIQDANYLDLFSGTGSYLFEALSRGAESATGVELEPKLVKSIIDQAVKFGIEEKLSCHKGDVFEIIPQLAKNKIQYSIVMIAPPQYRQLIDKTLYSLVQSELIANNGIIIIQHDSSETDKIKTNGYEILQRRKYGNTTFSILTLK